MSGETAAIKIQTKSGERFFSGIGHSGRVQTAWSLAGAKLFLVGDDKLQKIVLFLEAKKKRFSVVDISVEHKGWSYRHIFLSENAGGYELIDAIRLIAGLGNVGMTAEMLTSLNDLVALYPHDDIPF